MDIESNQRIERRLKMRAYGAIADSHHGCNYATSATSVINRSRSSFFETKAGGLSRQTWRNNHEERILESLKTLDLSFVKQQNSRHRIVTRHASE